jgi:hypothetical protein
MSKHPRTPKNRAIRCLIPLLLLTAVGCTSQAGVTPKTVAFRFDVTESARNNPEFQRDWKQGCHAAVNVIQVGEYASFSEINSLNPVYTEPLKVTSKKPLKALCNKKPEIAQNSGATNPCIVWNIDRQHLRPNLLYLSAIETNDSHQQCPDTLKALVSGLEQSGGHFIVLGATNANNFNTWMREVLKDSEKTTSFCTSTQLSDVSSCVREAAKSMRQSHLGGES